MNGSSQEQPGQPASTAKRKVPPSAGAVKRYHSDAPPWRPAACCGSPASSIAPVVGTFDSVPPAVGSGVAPARVSLAGVGTMVQYSVPLVRTAFLVSYAIR